MVQKRSPSVAILMCTYNGENFLEEQLDSIQNQDYKNWTLFVNDDGSKDATLDILKRHHPIFSRFWVLHWYFSHITP